MLKTIIIEDELNVKVALENKIMEYCKNVEIIGWGNNVKKSVSLIKEAKPDLVLLDIKLPDGTGFDILKQLQPINFKIIFITAYNDYAIEAFRFSALDYLVKPVRYEELINAINKAENAVNFDSLNLRLDTLYNNLLIMTRIEKKIILNTSDKIEIIEIKDIIRCESDTNYTTFYLADKTKLVVTRTLKDIEEMLIKYNFFRSHKSHLINMSFLKTYEKSDGGSLIMKDGAVIPLSQRKKNYLLQILESL